MKSICTWLLGIFVLLQLSSCFAPQAVVRLEPDQQEQIRWYQGQANAEKEENDITCRAGFYKHDREYLFFDIEVINGTDQDLLVSPELFTLVHDGQVIQHALDPERLLLSTELRQSEREANAKNAAVLIGVATVAATVAVVASDNNRQTRSDNRTVNALNTASTAVDLSLSGFYLAQSVASAGLPAGPPPPEVVPPASVPEFWADYTLRRTTLAPGEQVRGLVGFRRVDHLADFSLVLPIESQAAPQFLFRQRVYRP